MDVITCTFDVTTNTAILKSTENCSNVALIAATYNQDGLIDFKIKNVDISVGYNNVQFEGLVKENADCVKVFVWESYESMKPLCEVIVVR